MMSKGLFTWRDEDPSIRKALEGKKTFRLVYMQKFRSGWPRGERTEGGRNCRPLAAEGPAAAMFVFLVPITRTFQSKVVYVILDLPISQLGRSYHHKEHRGQVQPFAYKLNKENIWR